MMSWLGHSSCSSLCGNFSFISLSIHEDCRCRRESLYVHSFPVIRCQSHGRKQNKLSDERPVNRRLPLTDDGARRVIKERLAWESQLRKNNPGARGYKWIRRTPAQMAQFLENGRMDYRYAKHVDAAICTIRKLSSKPRDSYDFSLVMNPWVGRFSFKEMCIILKEQRNWVLAYDFFQWMKRQGLYVPSVIPYTILLKICGKEKQLDIVQNLYTEMVDVGCEPDEVVISTLIYVYGKSGDVLCMMEFYNMMRSQGLMPTIVVYNFMLSSLYKVGSFVDAVIVWEDIMAAKVMPTDYTYSIVINVYRKLAKFTEAIRVFEEMMLAGHLPDGILYNMVINMMGKLNKEDEILDTYKKMKTQGLMISKHTYTYLVHFFCKGRNYELAMLFFSEMQRQGCEMDEVVYGTIISIYGQLGMYDDAELAFKEMDAAGLVVTDRVFIIMATVRMKACKYSHVFEIFDDMKSRGFKMSKYAWIIILQCCVKQQKLSHAESAFEVMLKQGFADSAAYTCMFSLYKKLGLFEAGEPLLSNLESSRVKLDEKLYGSIIDLFCSAGMILQAERYFIRMQDDGLTPTRSIKTMLIQAYGKAGRVKDAESLYYSLDRADAMAMIAMFEIYDLFGNKEEAKALSRCLMQSNLESYNNLILKCVRKGATDTASFLCSQMLETGKAPVAAAYSALVSSLLKQRQCPKALELVELASTRGLQSDYP